MNKVSVEFKQKITTVDQIKVGQFAEVYLREGEKTIMTVGCTREGPKLIDLCNPQNQWPDLALNATCRLVLPGETIVIKIEDK